MAEDVVRTSDGLEVAPVDEETTAERMAAYRDWAHHMGAERPEGHELVATPAEPRHFTPLEIPLSEARVALVTTGGVHLPDDEPFDVDSWEGDHTLRWLPDDVDTSALAVTHTHYPTQDVERDVNVMFPIDRLHELAEQGVIGSVSDMHVGFMGFQPDPALLLSETAPEAGRELQRRGVDVVVLTGG